jgi:hypothetical protein
MLPAGMALNPGQVMVVEAGSFQSRVGELEPQRLNQVQDGAGIGAQADDIAGIWRNLRLIQNHVKHR